MRLGPPILLGRVNNQNNNTIVGVIDISNFGAKIKSERERQGYSLEDVARETKIRELYLNAIEEENFAILPPRVYATGFVTRYALYLKLDASALTSEFQNLAYKNDQTDEPVLIQKKKDKRGLKIPVKNILVSALFLIVVLWLGNYLVSYMANWNVNRTPAVQESQPGDQAANSENTPVADKLLLDIEARELCWLRVEVDGIEVYSAIMAVGEKLSFEAKQTIIIKAGNAGGIDLSLNRKLLAPLGNYGEVVEKTYTINSIGKE